MTKTEALTEVPVTTVDAFLAAQQLHDVFLVSIDAEGYDALVLEGMRHSLLAKRVRIVEFEYGAKGFWAPAPSSSAALAAPAAASAGVAHEERRTLHGVLNGVLGEANYSCYWQTRKRLVPALAPCWRHALTGPSASHSNLVCAHDSEVLEVFEGQALRAASAHALVDEVCAGKPRKLWRNTSETVAEICERYYRAAARECACADGTFAGT